jgi:hypothetical protein
MEVDDKIWNSEIEHRVKIKWNTNEILEFL